MAASTVGAGPGRRRRPRRRSRSPARAILADPRSASRWMRTRRCRG